MKYLFSFIFYVIFIIYLPSFAQLSDTTETINCRKRKFLTTGIYVTGYTAGMTALYHLWYKDYPMSTFRFFDDNSQWMQMDKGGHVYSAYILADIGYKTAQFSCLNKNHSIWLGGGAGLLFLTTIELFDGFSSEWGASLGDLTATFSGYILFAFQQKFWNDQKIRMKFSYNPSIYAKYRPELLGNSFLSEILKDYNAQTYWLSFNPFFFDNNDSKFWPDWLCLSAGYSADGMLGGSVNPTEINGTKLPYFERKRQLYLSFDIDFSRFNTNSKFLNTIFELLNVIKVPFPAISYDNRQGINAHFIYY